MWPSSISISPEVVSMWVLRVPSPNGTSVMTWFIFMGAGAAPPFPRNSSRILRASSIHSGLRNGYFGKAVSLGQRGQRVSARGTLVVWSRGDKSALELHQAGERARLDLVGDGVRGGEGPHDEPTGEGRELVEVAVDAARALELAERRHRADHAPRQHQRVV